MLKLAMKSLHNFKEIKMQKIITVSVLSASLWALLGFTSAPEVRSEVVTYECGNKVKYPLEVKYGFVDGVAVNAIVTYRGKTYPQMIRDSKAVNSDTEAVFVTKDGVYTWVADYFTIDDVKTKSGNMLYEHKTNVDEIIGKYCDIKPNQAVPTEKSTKTTEIKK